VVSHYSHAITAIAEALRLGGRFMLLRNVLRKIFLCIALGGRPVFGIGMSQQKIEELLHAMHQTRVEMTISDDGKASDLDR
jgi:hypothetical protein